MLGCFVATVGICVIACVWYERRSPAGRVWMSRNYPGKTADEIGKSLRPALGISIVSFLMLNLLLRFILVNYFHVKSVLDAVKFTVGLSCLATFVEIPHCLFSSHSVDAFIIDQLFNLMSLALSGVCIAYFG